MRIVVTEKEGVVQVLVQTFSCRDVRTPNLSLIGFERRNINGSNDAGTRASFTLLYL
jgi:hypothetical protein